jgi:L,D-transpeptidase catalytic domain
MKQDALRPRAIAAATVRMRWRANAIALLSSLALTAMLSGSASANVLIQVDKATQRMTVSEDGAQLYSWPVSTGRRGYSTPSGSFRPFRMDADHHSEEWDNAPMPYSIFFTREGHAIHGSFETNHLGRAASHGCVRLSPQHAATLFALVRHEGLANTRVVVGNGPPMIAKSSRPERSARADIDNRVVFGRTLPDVGDLSAGDEPPAHALLLPWYGRVELDPTAPIH